MKSRGRQPIPKLANYLPTIYSRLLVTVADKRHPERFLEAYEWLLGCQLRGGLAYQDIAEMVAELCNVDQATVLADLGRFHKWRQRLRCLGHNFDSVGPKPPTFLMLLFLLLPLEQSEAVSRDIMLLDLEVLYSRFSDGRPRVVANCLLLLELYDSAKPIIATWARRAAIGGGGAALLGWLGRKSK